MHLIELLALLGGALLAAKVLGGVASRFGVPSVLAELMVGVAIGNVPGVWDHLGSSELIAALSELGVLFLLFLVGLETDIKEIGKVGKDAAWAAMVGVLVPFALAFVAVPMITKTSFEHTLFMAAALTATSVGITARVLKDLRKLKSVSGQIILGAAVIDDILGVIILTVVSALVTTGVISGAQFAVILLKIAAFGLGVYLLRKYVLPSVLRPMRHIEVSGTVTIFLVSMLLISAWLSEVAGLAAIIGAFALGIALDDVHFKGYQDKGEHNLEELMKPIMDFLAPVFFVVMGMNVKLKAMANPDSLALAGTLIVIGILGKLACGLPLSRSAIRKGADRLMVGYGMIPRGEVGLIFAAMGLKLKVLNQADYAAVVAMVAVTTLAAPILLGLRATKLKQG